ncbi:MAG: hypothetical protein QF682_05585 [Candidatus Thermoplasmatota archaeon]|nr:hypothetical protein [Candidatus Thermoplasmatota archaeon]
MKWANVGCSFKIIICKRYTMEDIGFLSHCRNCRKTRLFVDYQCSKCETEHSRRLRDGKRIKDPEIGDVVLKTQERICPQCREMVPLKIMTDREMLGLLVRKYPACPECQVDLSDEAIEVTISMFDDFSIQIKNFKLEDMHLCLGLILLLRHFKKYVPEDEEFGSDFYEWKKWAVSTLLSNIIDTTGPAQMAFGRFLLDYKCAPGKKINELIKEHFGNIELKMELLGIFGFKDESPAEKKKFEEKLLEVLADKTGVEQEPITLSSVEMYQYELVFVQQSDEEDEDEDEDEEEDEDGEEEESGFTRIIKEIEIDINKLSFKTRTTKVKKKHGKEATIATYNGVLVVDNAGKTVYLYRAEGFVPKDEKQTSFKGRRLLDAVIKTQADPSTDSGDIFSPDFFDKLPCNDICYIAHRLGKPYLATYEFQDIVFGPGENRDFSSYEAGADEGFSKPEPRDEMIHAILDHGETVKLHKRVGICQKCAGITRPFLREKWECPHCGSRDPAKEYYCSNCITKIGVGDSLCGNCGEFLI